MNRLEELDRPLVLRMYETLLKIRFFEETQARVFRDGEQEGFTHLYVGEEAVAVGACANLNADDYITSTHRGHGHLIAKGGDLKRIFSELYGRKTGYCLGRSGSLHIADYNLGVLGANGIVGDGNPIAVGAGYSIRLRGTRQVAVSFFGDGASNQGTFHESLNMAASWNLPVVFVIENNGMSCGVPTNAVCKMAERLEERARGYGMPGRAVDGNDVVEVYDAVKAAVKRARKGEGPTLLNCRTFRWRGHFEGDIDIRDKAEIREGIKNDPIARLERQLLERNILDDEMISQYRANVRALVDKAVDFARSSPPPEPQDAFQFVYAE